MKKSLIYLSIATLVAAGACKSNDDDNKKADVVISPIKTLTWTDTEDTEAYAFTYDDKKRVANIVDVYDDDTAGADNIMYDYSVANQLTITKGGSPTVYTLDASGRVTYEKWDDTSGAKYAYDANGYLLTVTEFYDAADHLKYQMTILNGNTTQIVTFDDDGTTVTKTKTFSYTSGVNVNQFQQDNAIDSNWKSTGGIFGKPNTNVIDFAEYWAPGNEANKSKTTYTYTFDTQNRISTSTKNFSAGGNPETITLTY